MAEMDRLSESGAMPTSIGVVIPVLHEHAALAQLLKDLQLQSRVPEQIVVVSGARDERIAELVHQAGHRLIDSAPGRGIQLDAGARATDAAVLWFVHADARLPQSACADVLDAVSRGAAGGCLRLVFQTPRPLTARAIEWLVRLRIACGGMAYGDQALFCTAQAYLRSGGFPPLPLFEEVRLIRHLRRSRGFVALTTPVYVCARRWERDGWVHRSLHNRWLALQHMLGAAPEALARSYEPPTFEKTLPAARSDLTEPRG